MSRPVLIDLFSGAGGAAAGYDWAGFDVIGVDIVNQPNYPFTFMKADVLELDLPRLIKASGAVVVHASPPTQRYSPLAAYHGDRDRHPDLIPSTRQMLRDSGLYWVMENVPRAPLQNARRLCGSMFPGLRVFRHRCFELNIFDLHWPRHEPHVARCMRNGYLPAAGQFMSIHAGTHSRAWQRKACEVMGTEWMAVSEDAGMDETKAGVVEVSESTPPAFTRLIGSQLITLLRQGVAA
jgi:DNA (cytosine-5)-methyltransferase 1